MLQVEYLQKDQIYTDLLKKKNKKNTQFGVGICKEECSYKSTGPVHKSTMVTAAIKECVFWISLNLFNIPKAVLT